jgi:hypothetical protein
MKIDQLKDLRSDGRTLLKWILKKWDGKAWAGLLWVRIGNGGGIL